MPGPLTPPLLFPYVLVSPLLHPAYTHLPLDRHPQNFRELWKSGRVLAMSKDPFDGEFNHDF